MRLALRVSVAVLLVLPALTASGRAQSVIPNDPFFLYYGYVLPQQNQQNLQQLNTLQNQQFASTYAQQRNIQQQQSDFMREALDELSQPLGQRRAGRPSAGFDNTTG